jgi:hypothetical protein
LTALISATLIVRDEARFLPGCLDSIAGLVDDIVVVDTGGNLMVNAWHRPRGGGELLDWRRGNYRYPL